ncbi:MAG TPA: exosortase/archaeosortase family protein [Clostridia bacterium]|nr:exosortase/archaeosortase family protein [Clostridia bacterium]
MPSDAQIRAEAPPTSALESAVGKSVWSYWPIALLAAVVAALYGSVLPGLVKQWYADPEYSHGFLVPVVSAYALWTMRERLRTLRPKPAVSFGGVALIASLMLLFLGSLGAELFLTRVSLLATITALVLYFGGWTLLQAIAFPLGFLLLAIPLPAILYNQIVFPLQLLASQLATGCLDTAHVVPILREGNVLILPNTTLEVVEACSGIRSLMSLITLAVAYGFLTEKSIAIRWLLALGMVPVAIFTNSVRVMSTATITYYWGVEAAEGFTHTFSGLAIFIAATFLMIGLHAALRKTWKTLHWERA